MYQSKTGIARIHTIGTLLFYQHTDTVNPIYLFFRRWHQELLQEAWLRARRSLHVQGPSVIAQPTGGIGAYFVITVRG